MLLMLLPLSMLPQTAIEGKDDGSDDAMEWGDNLQRGAGKQIKALICCLGIRESYFVASCIVTCVNECWILFLLLLCIFAYSVVACLILLFSFSVCTMHSFKFHVVAIATATASSTAATATPTAYNLFSYIFVAVLCVILKNVTVWLRFILIIASSL